MLLFFFFSENYFCDDHESSNLSQRFEAYENTWEQMNETLQVSGVKGRWGQGSGSCEHKPPMNETTDWFT